MYVKGSHINGRAPACYNYPSICSPSLGDHIN